MDTRRTVARIPALRTDGDLQKKEANRIRPWPLLLVFLLLIGSLLLICFVQSDGLSVIERAVPEDIFALVILNDPQSGLDLLSRAEKLPSLDQANILKSLRGDLLDQLTSLLGTDLRELSVIVHFLEGREGGSWRIHFSALLEPWSGRRQIVEERVRLMAAGLFGESRMQSFQQEASHVYKGGEAGQILYQLQMPGFMILSNSYEGLQQTLDTWFEKQPRLFESASFRRIRNHLRMDEGAIIYLNSRRVLPMLPEVGYQIRKRGDRIVDEIYVSAP